jgi:hypothetical protein
MHLKRNGVLFDGSYPIRRRSLSSSAGINKIIKNPDA